MVQLLGGPRSREIPGGYNHKADIGSLMEVSLFKMGHSQSYKAGLLQAPWASKYEYGELTGATRD